MVIKVTDWFDGDVRPVRKGYYKRLDGIFARYWYWRGKEWESGGWSCMANCSRLKAKSPYQNLPWCGLASDPKASKP
jgi:hypothetical protein